MGHHKMLTLLCATRTDAVTCACMLPQCDHPMICMAISLHAARKYVPQILKGWGTEVNLLENNNAAMQIVSV